MSKSEDLFWKIFNSKNEDELNKIIIEDELLSDNNNWTAYGKNKGNSSIFEIQQPHPIAALVEKLTNSIDSILLKECRIRNIDPKSDKAPKSMAEAVEKFFNIKNGNFRDLLHKERRVLAENIKIIADGDMETPNIIVFDNGEGQHPDDFPDTFLSLPKENSYKRDIHFVQGKYNFGSAGAVVFCGENRYQLILSKLNEDLFSKNHNHSENDYGFTLVRRHPFEENGTYTWYEYFVINDKISRFYKESINIESLGLNFNTGTIIKLYSYQLPPGTKSDITRGFWEELNQFLFEPALPLLIDEKREKYSYDPIKRPPKPMLGNFTRILLSESEIIDKTVNIKISNPEIGKVKILCYVFKSKTEGDFFIKRKPVVYTINGQIHGVEHKSFISQELNYSMLKDCMLIHIDCTEIKPIFRQDLFMANRYTMKEGNKYYKFKELIINELKDNEELRKSNQDKKEKLLGEDTLNQEEMKNLFESIPVDKDLLKLLGKNGNLNFFQNHNKINEIDNTIKKSEDNESKKLDRYPSIFKINLKENVEGRKIKSIPLNGKGTISFETDVMDDYLYRPDERGDLSLYILKYIPSPNNLNGGNAPGKPQKIEDIIEVTTDGPNDGVIKITFKPKKELNVGDELNICTKLTSPNGNLEAIFYIKIIDKLNKEDKPKEKQYDQPSLPKPIQVFKEKHDENDRIWDEFGWKTGDNIVQIIAEDDVIQGIAVNMDSNVLLKYLSKNKINSPNKIIHAKNKYFYSVYFHSLFLYGILEKYKKSKEIEENENYNFETDVLIEDVFKYYSSFLLHLDLSKEIINSLDRD